MPDTPREHLRDVAARLEALRDAVEACTAAAPDPPPPAGGQEEEGGDGLPLAEAVGAAMRECERRVLGVRASGLSLVGRDSYYWAKAGTGLLDAARRRGEPLGGFTAVFRAVPLVEARG